MLTALRSSVHDVWRFLFGSWRRAWFGAWLSLLMFAFVKNAVSAAKADDRVGGLGIITCALSTFLFWTCRAPLRRLAGGWRLRPVAKFLLIGGLGAVWAEFIYWGYQEAFGITGVAANANFWLDLLVTMPWYLLMLAILWRVVTRHAYSFRELLVFGGIYDMCADGALRQIIGGVASLKAALLDVAALPMFVFAYSFIVLPACVLVWDDITSIREARPPRKGNRYLYGLLPAAGLIPYAIVLFGIGMVAKGGLWR
jgi:hypothetical protein